MNERSTHLNAFIYNSTPIRIVSQRYRTFLISSTTSSSSLVVDLAAFVLVPIHRRLSSSFSSYVSRFLRRSLFSSFPLSESYVSHPRPHRLSSPSSPFYPSSTLTVLIVVSCAASSTPHQLIRFRRSRHRRLGVESSRFRRLWPDQHRTIRVHRYHVLVSSPLSSSKQEHSYRRVSSSMIVSPSPLANDTPPDLAGQRTQRAGVLCLQHRRLHYRRHPGEACIAVFLQSFRLPYRRNCGKR